MPRLCPLFSGSSGNSYYIGSAERGVLIDAGRSAKQICDALTADGLDIRNVEAIFVTHEHIDHAKGLRVLAKKYHLRVYATEGTIEALAEKELIDGSTDIVPITRAGAEAGGLTVVPFRISHDCREGVGYRAASSDGRSTAFVTDTGCISDEIRAAVTGCDTVVLESNHDEGMLRCGSYPYILKRRILSDIGHLSNDVCAQTAVELVRSGTTRLILAHLSRENNYPQLALQTSLCAFEMNGMKQNLDFMLSVAPVENKAGAILY